MTHDTQTLTLTKYHGWSWNDLADEVYAWCEKYDALTPSISHQSTDDCIADPACTPEDRVELDALGLAFVLHESGVLTDTHDSLVAEYRQWCDTDGLPHMSADELYAEILSDESEITGTPAQRAHLIEYIDRWDIMEDRERAS